MEKRSLSWAAWCFAGLTVLVVGMMLANTLRRPAEITLPDTTERPSQTPSETQDSTLTIVEITPETVQAAVATLARPELYSRSIVVEQFWESGSASYEVSAAVSGAWTRTDRTLSDGNVRHCISGTDSVYIWYNHETQFYQGTRGEITPDNEQTIPTYEEILSLSLEAITVADYQRKDDVNCIYVEASEENSTLRYWVSVETGLLAAAEKLVGETMVYRMSAQALELAEPTVEDFTLPDGTQLLSE